MGGRSRDGRPRWGSAVELGEAREKEIRRQASLPHTASPPRGPASRVCRGSHPATCLGESRSASHRAPPAKVLVLQVTRPGSLWGHPPHASSSLSLDPWRAPEKSDEENEGGLDASTDTTTAQNLAWHHLHAALAPCPVPRHRAAACGWMRPSPRCPEPGRAPLPHLPAPARARHSCRGEADLSAEIKMGFSNTSQRFKAPARGFNTPRPPQSCGQQPHFKSLPESGVPTAAPVAWGPRGCPAPKGKARAGR